MTSSMYPKSVSPERDLGTEAASKLGLEARVVATNNSAESLASRVLVLIDRLLGPTPVGLATKTDRPTPYGIFEQLTESSRQTQARIDEAHEALDRLEASL